MKRAWPPRRRPHLGTAADAAAEWNRRWAVLGLGTLELELAVDGLLVTGSWTERTASTGYYRGAV